MRAKQLTAEEFADGWRQYGVNRSCGHPDRVRVKGEDHLALVSQAQATPCVKCGGTDTFEAGAE